MDLLEIGPETPLLADDFATGPTCARSTDLGGATSTFCYWSYPFRDSLAREAFDAVSQKVRACAEDNTVVREGAEVNHPDSFTQITARIKGRDVSVSLKDKGGHAQTLVFLRVARQP
ncbi:hypothetical protein ACS3SW_06250 [Roseobacteraceae bacterium S113]